MSSVSYEPRVNLPPKRGPDVETKLCQAIVPEILLEAARAEWKRRGISARQVITWALLEYLHAVNPRIGQKIGRKLNGSV